eukprot:GEMP01056413.1.p1 GENE.GEMP01056413.1~~GEMP01056413.1.p1  ORF type:complete len:184 (+),score=17.90 GEMP01056413.1:230-781(+)
MKFSTLVLFLAQVAADTKYTLEITFKRKNYRKVRVNECFQSYTFELRVTPERSSTSDITALANVVLPPENPTVLKQYQEQKLRLGNRVAFSLGDLEVEMVVLKWPVLEVTHYVQGGEIIRRTINHRLFTYSIPFSLVEGELPDHVDMTRSGVDSAAPNRRLRGLMGEGGGQLRRRRLFESEPS